MEQLEERREREVHLRDYFKVILRRKWVVITFFVVVVVAVTVSTFAMKPVYRATCQVLIDRENPNVVKIEEVLAVDASTTDYYQTQYEILKNKLLAERAVKELRLVEHAEFNAELQKESFNIKGALFTVLKGVKALFLYSRDKGSQLPDRENQLISAYLSRLTIQPIRNSRLVNVSFDSHYPRLAARAANKHAKLYMEHSWERKFVTSQDAVRWLTQQIKDVRRKLEASEEALQRYRRDNNLVSIDFGGRHNIIVQKLSDLNNALTQAKTTRIEKENLYRELKRISKNPEMIESMPGVVNNVLVQQLKSQYVELGGEYSELSRKYGPEHPQMIRLGSQVKEIRNRIAQEVRKIARSIETEYRVALAKERSLLRVLEEQKKEALDLNQKEIQYNVLKREVETNRSMYESLLKRLKEASLTEELKVTNISIVDPARVPDSPAKPNKMLNLVLAVLMGLIGGVGLAFFFEYLDTSIKSSGEIEAQLGVPFLGHVENMASVVSNAGDEGLVVLHYPDSHIAEEFRTISTNLIFSIPDKPQKAMLITSAIAEEGKTVLAVNLAAVMAKVGKRVLVVDADMRKPNIHSLFELKREPGLSDLLAQGNLSSQILHAPSKGLYLVTAGTAPPNPAELFVSTRMVAFVKHMREKFDFIVFDTPPVMMLSDALTLAPVVDGVVLVVKSGVTPRATIQKAVQQLVRVNAKLIGAVLNDHDIEQESYYYRHYYHDYYRYYGKEDKEERTESV